MKRFSLCLALMGTFLLDELPAQGVPPHTKAIPEMFAGVYGGGGNWFPMGRTRGFIQYWIRGDQVSAKVWTSMGWRIGNTATSAPATAHKLEIKIGNTKATFSTLSKTYATNIGTSPTTFLALKTVNFPAFTGSRVKNPDNPAVWIKGDRPMVFTGPNIIIQVDIATSTTFGYISSYHADSVRTGLSPNIVISDKSCGGTLNASLISGILKYTLTGAKANTITLFLLGLRRLPVDFGFIFGPKCTAVVNPLAVIPVMANASGMAVLQGPYAPPSPIALYAQGLHLGGAGFVTTNSVAVWTGRNNLNNYLYSWTSTSKTTAQYGPYTTYRGPVHLIK